MTWRPLVTLRILLVLGLGVALFFVAFFGDDGFNNMPKQEVVTVSMARGGPQLGFHF